MAMRGLANELEFVDWRPKYLSGEADRRRFMLIVGWRMQAVRLTRRCTYCLGESAIVKARRALCR